MLFPLLAFLSLALTASSRLVATQPPCEQLPLIARVNKPYSWSLSPRTFTSTKGPISYSTSTLPPWLSFDPGTQTFHGTPANTDQGYPEITVMGNDSAGVLSEKITLVVTDHAEPTINLPLSQQFSEPAPSLSSVFIISPNTSLSTERPALRIPSRWSFSIGFQYETFLCPSQLFYEVRQIDGSLLPNWMKFNSKAITLNGVTPEKDKGSGPAVISLSLYVSDRKGYSASSLPFTLVVSDHELSIKAAPANINTTTETALNFSLVSQFDVSGIFVDERPIERSEIKTMVIDTKEYGWLKYDHGSWTLSGDPRNASVGQIYPLFVTLEAFNQSLRVPLDLEIVPSYFLAATLPPIQGIPGEAIDYDLRHDFSNVTKHKDDEITPTFDPPKAQEWLSYHRESGKLEGTVPSDFKEQQITITFKAYSSVTRSNSHTKLPIIFAPPEHTKKGFHPLGLSAAAHTRLVLGLGIAFGAIGGLCLLGGLLAVFRRCARVEDTAIGGEEGRNVWSEQDKQWYNAGRGYIWTNRDRNLTEKSVPAPDRPFNTGQGPHERTYGDLGLGLRRVSERSGSEGNKSSPGVMSKREFFERLRETVRVVSDKVQGRKVSRLRPIIGRPILPQQNESMIINSTSTFFEQTGLPSHPGSTIMTNSPSTSTAEHSIPRRRADFAPPRSPAQAHTRLSRQLSSGSSASNVSEKLHASEATVQTASKAMSIHSGKSASGKSFITEPPIAAGVRPRLVPFTSASRVPVPHRPSSPKNDGGSSAKRVNSQSAKVWRREPKDELGKGGSSDELKIGLHYVQSLGADSQSG
ncbi:Protein AXL2 [Termitomyces sp. J132]|nr:hypothetical protein C0989_001919 [Termitomyces sp. Mn162]KAH0582868.1 hypothetical protein H2248_010771 [Termitomyces sp. 'cryptogamus']KNZ74646.1 Protein AXL2 [Termitomyces sp. J132]